MPAVVKAKGALAFWRNLHPVLAARRHLLRPTGHVVFEMEGSGDGIGLRLWVSADISAHAVARAPSPRRGRAHSAASTTPTARTSPVRSPLAGSCGSRHRPGSHSAPTMSSIRFAP